MDVVQCLVICDQSFNLLHENSNAVDFHSHNEHLEMKQHCNTPQSLLIVSQIFLVLKRILVLIYQCGTIAG